MPERDRVSLPTQSTRRGRLLACIPGSVGVEKKQSQHPLDDAVLSCTEVTGEKCLSGPSES
jgi:hypothetical protein